MATQFIDDKSPICIPFILNRLQLHQQANSSSNSSNNHPPPPLIIGLNGLQGVGKSTLVVPLAEALNREGIPTLVCSIDDFYLTHEQQLALAHENPDNALWQVRGEPGTHDISLLKSVFSSLLVHAPTSLPQYDKALFSGQGDRLPPSTWTPINQQQPPQNPFQVVILEGWCVGFRPISPEAVAAKHAAPSRTLHQHRLEHLLAVNEKLGEYDDVTRLFDAFLHIDSENTEYVYDWRLEQEEHLRLTRGDPNAGMTKEQVIRFVDAYYPAYELYSEGLRNGLFSDKPGAQLRMVVGRDRKVKQVIEI
ncbi:P-loop containing nucleoside triphosphate hydrolase protein [Trichoderma pleuroticola]